MTFTQNSQVVGVLKTSSLKTFDTGSINTKQVYSYTSRSVINIDSYS
jgi:hypothetical protein